MVTALRSRADALASRLRVRYRKADFSFIYSFNLAFCVSVHEGSRNVCFICLGSCFLVMTVFIALAGLIVYFVGSAGPECRDPAVLTSCDSQTEQWPYYSDQSRGVCVARWLLDPGCLAGDNRFESEQKCEQECLQKVPRDKGCSAKVEAKICQETDFLTRDYAYAFEQGNCTKQTGPLCLYGANRYPDQSECLKRCQSKGGDPSCRVPRQEGPCRRSQKVHQAYFDEARDACVPWTTPCLAGVNKHASLEDCVRTCFSKFFENLKETAVG
ncbi:hypothetical protein HPB47_015306 [Ixodes persulcatus]|uniref:Uncharacterized protein n=1 Tax=Ixodes persulcatus TaxID=34615 RepID=A0AC60QWC5_IXOPE|nr:hypothetical protein HPB47_015306 [Ixodes persulcatus]